MPRPSPDRMNRFAIEVLSEASAAAGKVPLKPSPAVRLALAWLSINRVVTRDEIDAYWVCLTKPAQPADNDGYCRSRDLTMFVNRCRFLAGQK
jgi:hypothetical protein